MSVALELCDVSKHFGPVKAVESVSFKVPKGSFHALLGPSGCGKTTVLRMIAGLETPDTGEVILGGNRINSLRPYERNVSTVFQNYALFPHLSVRENIEFGLRRKKTATPEIARKVRESINMLQLTGKEDRKPAQLSGGEKQRVALARSLVLEPEVLLLDEPLSALDPQLRKQVRLDLKSIQRRLGIAFLFVTHDQEEALSLSDQIVLFNKGRVEQIGSPEDLYTRPRTRFAASFLGNINWIDGVGVRPEATRISHKPPSADMRSVPALVEQRTFLGGYLHIHAKLATGDLVTAEVPHSTATFEPGQRVHLSWQKSDEINASVN